MSVSGVLVETYVTIAKETVTREVNPYALRFCLVFKRFNDQSLRFRVECIAYHAHDKDNRWKILDLLEVGTPNLETILRAEELLVIKR